MSEFIPPGVSNLLVGRYFIHDDKEYVITWSDVEYLRATPLDCQTGLTSREFRIDEIGLVHMTMESITNPQTVRGKMSDEKYILMPESLTAENGAKGLLMGEFYELVEFQCSECSEDEPCEVCDGVGVYTEKVLIGWDTIKAIYAMAAQHLSKSYPQTARQSSDKQEGER